MPPPTPAEFPEIVELLNSTKPIAFDVKVAPPLPDAVLFVNKLLLTESAPVSKWMPPPLPPVTLFPENVQRVTVIPPLVTREMAPPNVTAVLLEKVQSFAVSAAEA